MKYLITVLFTCLSFVLYAQSPSELLTSAKEAYEKGDNSRALSLLANCEAGLGKTNPRIESFRAFCYANQGDWVNASVAITTYFRTVSSASQGTDAHKDLVALREKVDAEIAYADKQFKKKIDDERMKTAETFEQQQESVEKSRTASLAAESASAMYELYKNSTNPDDLQDFLTMFPKSANANEIRFKKFVADGDIDLRNARWNSAVENYNKALAIKKEAAVQSKLTRALDEQLFSTSARNNTMADFEYYLERFPSGLHKKEADETLQFNYLRLARDAAAAGEFDLTVGFYKAYSTRYPQGPEIQTVKNELCQFYFNEAQKAEKKMEMYSIKRALELYSLAQSCGISSPVAHINSLKRKVKRWARPDAFFLGWHMDNVNVTGLMAGSLNNKKIGMYISARMGKGFTETVADWKTNNLNSLAESASKNKTFTGETLSKTIHANLGLTKKIAFPLWIYAGVGATFSNELRQFRMNTGGSQEWVENKDAIYTAFNPEAGLYLLLGPFAFRYGINKPFNEKYTGSAIQHFGIGIKF